MFESLSSIRDAAAVGQSNRTTFRDLAKAKGSTRSVIDMASSVRGEFGEEDQEVYCERCGTQLVRGGSDGYTGPSWCSYCYWRMKEKHLEAEDDGRQEAKPADEYVPSALRRMERPEGRKK